MIDRLEQDLRLYRNALGVRGQRQELLASNMANVDTPHFKAKDIDFKSALTLAMGGTSGETPNLDLLQTHRAHLAGETGGAWDEAVKYRVEYQGAADGNTVNMDVERAAFAENALQLEALLTFVTGRFRTMQTAIQGQ